MPSLRIGHGELRQRDHHQLERRVGVLASAFNQMVMDLESKLRRLYGRVRNKADLIIETANDAFIGMDKDGLITDWNHQAEVIFGWSRQEVIGLALSDTIIPAAYRERRIQAGLRHFLQAVKARSVE